MKKILTTTLIIATILMVNANTAHAQNQMTNAEIREHITILIEQVKVLQERIEALEAADTKESNTFQSEPQDAIMDTPTPDEAGESDSRAVPKSQIEAQEERKRKCEEHSICGGGRTIPANA